MVNITQIKNGLSNYIDCEMLPNMADAGYKKIIFATGAAILIARVEGMLNKFKTNPILTALDIFDVNGNVDIDIIVDELCKNIPGTGLSIDIPFIGDIVLYTSDVRNMHNYIIRS